MYYRILGCDAVWLGGKSSKCLQKLLLSFSGTNTHASRKAFIFCVFSWNKKFIVISIYNLGLNTSHLRYIFWYQQTTRRDGYVGTKCMKIPFEGNYACVGRQHFCMYCTWGCLNGERRRYESWRWQLETKNCVVSSRISTSVLSSQSDVFNIPELVIRILHMLKWILKRLSVAKNREVSHEIITKKTS
jgi:hypothetical protein